MSVVCFQVGGAQSSNIIMATQYDRHSADFKEHVLLEYHANTRGSGYAALAKRFRLADPKIIRYWMKKYDGTTESLEKKTKPNRKRKLTEEESEKHVHQFVIKRNRAHKHVDYDDVQEEVKKRTGKEVAVRTLRRYGYEDYGITEKQTTRKLVSECIFFFTSPTLRPRQI